MSHLWVEDATGTWSRHPLETECVRLAAHGPVAVLDDEPAGGGDAPLLVRGGSEHGLDRWALLCAPASGVRVNGARVGIGVRMLCDRDAIAPGDGRTLFFSSERAAVIGPFPDAGHETFCIRCKLPLEAGSAAVRCPAPECGFWHHETPDQPCWSYAEGCAGCGHPTAFDAGPQWTPGEL